MIFVIGFLLAGMATLAIVCTPRDRDLPSPQALIVSLIAGSLLMLGSLLMAAWRHLP